jgi:mannose-1-phosphate guanylyltransferase
MTTIVPVILSGGAGSRLWPVSRESHPKPFMRLADGQSLLQKTFLRAAQLPGVEQILTVTNRELFFKTEDDYRKINAAKLPTSYLLEPFGRNTAAAVAAAALTVGARDPQALLLLLPADHLIADLAAFDRAVERAAELAAAGLLVTFGIRPDTPETGFGYIEADGDMVKRFVEKPDAETARGFVESGRFFWNSGMLCFSAATMLEEMQRHCPAVLAAVRACLEVSRRAEGPGFSQVELDADTFARTPEDSVDYAVLEKSARVAVVPCSIGWSDIGSWAAVSQLLPLDANGNRLSGPALLLDVHNCAIHAEDRLVGAIGVDGLIIVDTADALLVVAQDRVQDVKTIYAELKASNHPLHKVHRTVYRPWGTYSVLEEGENFKIKRIVVKPGQSLSMQMHHHRSEHWIVVSGTAKVFNGDTEMFVRTNESTYIPACTRHRVLNPGIADLVMIEVQSGAYLGEDDIVRYDDVYGRLGEAGTHLVSA